jgi:hypothetical protein
MSKSTVFVGLDVHAETIAVAVAEGRNEVRSLHINVPGFSCAGRATARSAPAANRSWAAPCGLTRLRLRTFREARGALPGTPLAPTFRAGATSVPDRQS